MRPEGLRTAAQALSYWERRQQVVAHNLANADTTGFKGERVFARLVADSILAAEARTDLRPGVLKPTGAPLDLALEGAGFFVVRTPAGERLVRGGSMQLDGEGRLVDAAGNPVLGENGPIVLPPGRIEIDLQGTIRVDGLEVDRLRVEDLPLGVDPTREEAGRYLPPPDRTPLPPEERRVRQGYLEESNVQAVEALVEMITVQRSFAAVHNTVRVIDGVLGTIANDLARVS